jgi:PAS domain S-box-containing protein
LDNLPDGIYFKDTASRFLRINQALSAHFGLSDPSEAVGKTDFDFFTEEHARPAFEDEQDVMRSGRPIVGKEEKETGVDGRQRWVSTTKMPLRDPDGTIIGTFGVSRNITRRKQAEEALAKERNLLRILIDNLPDYIYVKDTESRFLINNLAHVRALGATQTEEVVGKTDFDFFPAELARQYYADEQAIVKSGVPLVNRTQPRIDLAGTQRWVQTSKFPLRDSAGQIVGILGISREVPEPMRTADELLRTVP